MRRERTLFFDWYNQERPHMTLKGATPDEVYFNQRPANRSPRFEPRPNWPRSSPCAKPQTLVEGQPGVILEMKVQFAARRRHLPCVKLDRSSLKFLQKASLYHTTSAHRVPPSKS